MPDPFRHGASTVRYLSQSHKENSMSLKTYQGVVKIKTGGPGSSTMQCKVRVIAENAYKAKLQLEEQYGRGSLLGTPIEQK